MSVRLQVTAVCLAVVLLAACSGVEVKPWQRNLLAEPGMQLDADATSAKLQRQYYYSREAARGGEGFSGTGCGCN